MNIDTDSVEKCAQLCYEVNRIYSMAVGQPPRPSWDEAPLSARVSMCQGVETILKHDCLITGQQMHEAWVESKLADGWTYGEKLDREAKVHPSLVPYSSLPGQERFKDTLAITIVRTVFVDIGKLGPEVPGVLKSSDLGDDVAYDGV